MSYSNLTGIPAQDVEAILIGGPNDGDRLAVVPSVDHIKCPTMVRSSYGLFDEVPKPAQQIETYHLARYGLTERMRRGEFLVFVHDSLRPDSLDIVQMLIDGYRRS